MTEVTVYGIPGSPYLRAVLLGLEEKHAAYRLVRVTPPETKQPAHLARHPFGRIPAMEHGDFPLYETQAMLRYIDAVFPGIALTPAEPRAAARMNQMAGIVDWYFFRDVGITIVFNRIVAPTFGMPTNEEVVKAAIPKAETCVRVIDGLIGNNDFVAGEQLSIADLMLAPQLDMFGGTPEGAEILAPYPRLNAYLARMRARDSMRRTTWQLLAEAA
jgi:glutathione S-transferase